MMNGATNQKCGAGEQPLDQGYRRNVWNTATPNNQKLKIKNTGATKAPEDLHKKVFQPSTQAQTRIDTGFITS